MVEEIVNNIIEAEDAADKKVKAAKEQAKEIVSSAQRDSEVRRAACMQECKAIAETARKANEKAAQKKYDEVLADGKAQAAEKSKEYDKNMEKAVNSVLSAIVDQE
jgi:vacuolar-type H+-ATPase subunit H